MKHTTHPTRSACVADDFSEGDFAVSTFSARFGARLTAGLVACAAGMALHLQTALAAPLPWMDTTLAPEQRAALLVGAMTLDQKEQQLVGNQPEIVPELPNCRGARHVRGIASLVTGPEGTRRSPDNSLNEFQPNAAVGGLNF